MLKEIPISEKELEVFESVKKICKAMYDKSFNDEEIREKYDNILLCRKCICEQFALSYGEDMSSVMQKFVIGDEFWAQNKHIIDAYYDRLKELNRLHLWAYKNINKLN